MTYSGWYAIKPNQIKLLTECKLMNKQSIRLEHWLQSLLGGRLPLQNEGPIYDTKQSDDKALVLKFWRMWRTLSLPLLPGLLWPRMVAPDRVPCLNRTD